MLLTTANCSYLYCDRDHHHWFYGLFALIPTKKKAFRNDRLTTVTAIVLQQQQSGERLWTERASTAQLIERRAGLRKHLPVQGVEHLSDPAHIRWFPCLRCLPAAPCGPAPIGCPWTLLFPPHPLILRRLTTSPLVPPLATPTPLGTTETIATTQLGGEHARKIKRRAQSSAWPLTFVFVTQTGQPWRLPSFFLSLPILRHSKNNLVHQLAWLITLIPLSSPSPVLLNHLETMAALLSSLFSGVLLMKLLQLIVFELCYVSLFFFLVDIIIVKLQLGMPSNDCRWARHRCCQ